MQAISVLRKASDRIYHDVKDLAGSLDAGGNFGVGAGGDISKKIDIVAERAVLDYLRETEFPCVVLGEECGRVELSDDPLGYVIMDAIDGTANAVRGFPFFCSSLAFADGYSLGHMAAGVVKDLSNGSAYWASRGRGAFMDGERIRASRGDPDHAIIGINVSGATPDILRRLQPLMKIGHIRHMGANALEMAWFSRGLMDAFVDVRGKIRIQDVAAGHLLAREAGGLLLDTRMKPLDADLGYGTRVSFIAAADQDTARMVADAIL